MLCAKDEVATFHAYVDSDLCASEPGPLQLSGSCAAEDA